MRTSIFAATALALSFAGAAAVAADSPWYVSADFGGYFRQPVSYATTFDKTADRSIKASGTVTRDYDPGVSGHLALGYRLSPRLRLEGELGETAYTGSTVYPYTTDPRFPALNGSPWPIMRAPSIHRFSGAANAFYDFPAFGPFTPYVGLGLGAIDASASSGLYSKPGTILSPRPGVSIPIPGPTFTTSANSGVDGFGQAEAGMSLRLSRHWSVTPAYRFVRAFGANGDMAHIAKVGLRYDF
jgi:opacity protein-like surface antigen